MDELSLPPNWQLRTVQSVTKVFISGGTPPSERPDYWGGAVAWTTSAPLADEQVFLDVAQRYITEQGVLKSATHVVPAGNMLVGTRVGVGKAVVNRLDIAISQDLTGIVFDPAQVEPSFVAFQFKAGRIRQYFDSRKRGTTIKGVSRHDLETLTLPLPPLAEQRAIAYTLRTVQAAGEARRREIALERERKAALMQHLFTHGICNEPCNQTEISKMPERWESVCLGDIIVSGPQNGIFIEKPSWGTGYPFVNVYDIYQSSIVDLTKIQRLEADISRVAGFLLNKDDILFVRSSLKRQGVGQCCLIRDIVEPTIFDCHLIRVVPDTARVIPAYLTYYFLSEQGRSDLISHSKTTTMTTINQKTLTQLHVPLPSISEQKSISEAIDVCDTKIAALEREAGLLDELFRAMLEELMSGRLSAMSLIQNDMLPIAADGAE